MAKTQFIDTPDELKKLFRKAFQQRDRFILGVLQGQRREPSKKQKRLLRRKAIINDGQDGRGSMLKYLADIWQPMTDEQKAVWTTAGEVCGLTNWQLFVSDNAQRIKYSLELGVPPSDIWQVRTGRILIEAPASSIILQQDHLQSYAVAQKIPGTPWKYQIVNLTEIFTLPIEIGIRYKADLTATGGTQYARYKARVWSKYQGIDRYDDVYIDLDPSTDWVYDTLEITVIRGIIVSYTLYIEIEGYTGELLFDNVRAIHGGTNWARDPRCDDISKIFEGAFSIVPPFWIPVSLPAGASYSSVFPPAL